MDSHHAKGDGYRTSAYSSSSAKPFSAADAYAQYDYASQSQQQQPQTTSSSQHRFPSQPSTNRDSVLSRAPGNPLAQNRWSANRDVESNHRPPPRQQHAESDGEEDDDDDDDEDWNVYDDFNNNNNSNTNPTSVEGLPSAPSIYDSGDTGLYASGNKYSVDAFSTPGLSPFSEYPIAKQPLPQRNSTLLTPDAFGFDVQNADPRHPEVIAQRQAASNDLHRADSHHVSGHDPDKNESGIELITVPALGQEFTKEEMSQMRRPYKRKVKAARRKQMASRWSKGDYKICGWLSPRIAVLLAFIGCVLLGVTLFFVVPRVPTIAFLSTNPLEAVPDASSMSTSHYPTNFSMTMNLNLRGDNTAGWIPSHASSMKVEVRELTTQKKIGEGTMNDMTFPGRGKKVFQLPVDFSYRSLNVTGDSTYLAVHNACAHKYPNTPRPNLVLGVKLSMNIAGLIGTKSSSTNLNTPCPFELQNDQ